jgi:hypothetical protein
MFCARPITASSSCAMSSRCASQSSTRDATVLSADPMDAAARVAGLDDPDDARLAAIVSPIVFVLEFLRPRPVATGLVGTDGCIAIGSAILTPAAVISAGVFPKLLVWPVLLLA